MWWFVKFLIFFPVGVGLLIMGSAVNVSQWVGIAGALLVLYSFYVGLRAALWLLAKILGWFKEEANNNF